MVQEELVSRQPCKPVFVENYLRGKIDRVDLANLLGIEHVDHVLGHELPHLADAGQTFDKDRFNGMLILETFKVTNRDILNHVLCHSPVLAVFVFRRITCRMGHNRRLATGRDRLKKGYRFDLPGSAGFDHSLTLPGFRFLDELAFATGFLNNGNRSIGCFLNRFFCLLVIRGSYFDPVDRCTKIQEFDINTGNLWFGTF